MALPIDSDFIENLIESHKLAFKHLLNLFEGIDEDKWIEYPDNSIWSMQSIAVEIINYQIKLMNNLNEKSYEFASDEIAYNEFIAYSENINQKLYNLIRQEQKRGKFAWKEQDSDQGSLYWVIVRSIQHCIYHAGGASLLRSILKLPKADYSNWPKMVDSVFEAALFSQIR